MGFEFIALVCTALFAGAAAYVTFVEHPAHLESGTAVALKQLRPSYRRGTVMQAALAVLGFAAGIAAWLGGRGPHYLAAAVLIGSVVPFTLLVIRPTNKQLLDESLDPGVTHRGGPPSAVGETPCGQDSSQRRRCRRPSENVDRPVAAEGP